MNQVFLSDLDIGSFPVETSLYHGGGKSLRVKRSKTQTLNLFLTILLFKLKDNPGLKEGRLSAGKT